MENNKYQKACIYKICCKDPSITDCYVGSTTDFVKRRYDHKWNCDNSKYKKYYKLYRFINNNGGWNNFNMQVIEQYPCNCKEELHRREGYFIRLLNCSLNAMIAGRTVKEYRIDKKDEQKQYRVDNREKILAQKKHYYNQNKEHLLIKQKQPYTCICGKTLTIGNKSRHCKSKKHINFIENQNS